MIAYRLWYFTCHPHWLADHGRITPFFDSDDATIGCEDKPRCNICKQTKCYLIDLKRKKGDRVYWNTPFRLRPWSFQAGLMKAALDSSRNKLAMLGMLALYGKKMHYYLLPLIEWALECRMPLESVIPLLQHVRWPIRSHRILKLLRARGWSPFEILTVTVSCRIVVPQYVLALQRRLGDLTPWLRDGGMDAADAEAATANVFSGWTRINGATLRGRLEISTHAHKRYQERVRDRGSQTSDIIRCHFQSARHLQLAEWTNRWTNFQRERINFFSDGTCLFMLQCGTKKNPNPTNVLISVFPVPDQPLPQ